MNDQAPLNESEAEPVTGKGEKTETGKSKAKSAKRQPVTYTPEIAQRICTELATGRTLISVCEDEGMPSEYAVRMWALDNKGGTFASDYTRAREIGYLHMADDVLHIADTAVDPQIARLQVDTRKWLLSKCLPKIYGDRVQHVGDADNPVKMQVEAGARLSSLLEQIAARADTSSADMIDVTPTKQGDEATGLLKGEGKPAEDDA